MGSDEHIDELFAKADKKGDGKIDWEEFKMGYDDLLSGIGLSTRDVLQSLNEIETRIFQERVKLIENGDDLSGMPRSRQSFLIRRSSWLQRVLRGGHPGRGVEAYMKTRLISNAS